MKPITIDEFLKIMYTHSKALQEKNKGKDVLASMGMELGYLDAIGHAWEIIASLQSEVNTSLRVDPLSDKPI